ncbi:aminoglycoside adenylyltransferase domain-containing protein [Allonocardiopsis opalescens]|uniref:Uncharacterized protein DUF4111 n=1 Tax=Allonocardiopsis opalescens TaxID=1144618 RepID=A0A2T0PTS5_9ACTN|nr:aminoglycoside adenylyltransferase domain-containing protein [Allonocardiopsis opalescens]PRX92302.1 uncharacterized protein DUF4111 [Allonocardiopsis opalescens]
MAKHPLAWRVAEQFLAEADAAAPGLVEGLYLTGSAALDDFRPHTSDVDAVVITAKRPDQAGLAALRTAHARLRETYPRPRFEGVHLTWADLAAHPGDCPNTPYAQGGRFRPSGRFELNPVTWHVLATKGLAVRGPARDELDVHDVRDGLVSWSLGNLEQYWVRWRERASRIVTPRGLAALGSLAPTWGVLGVSRLHFTLFTREITSKSGAGRYALHAFPARWHAVVNEALRMRRGSSAPSLYASAMARRRAALDYIEMVLDSALSPRLAAAPTA